MAKISFRLVPDQTPAKVRALFEKHLASVAPQGVRVEVKELHGGRPWRAKVEGPAFEAAAEALEETFGSRPVLMGGGGSIPIVPEMEERLGATALLVGFSLPGCNLHAPNEWLPLAHFDMGIETLARLYTKLGEKLGR
jgi:acetylornithine deacetylase/succinyl-diaminopimelate desuccinylase-like protein